MSSVLRIWSGVAAKIGARLRKAGEDITRYRVVTFGYLALTVTFGLMWGPLVVASASLFLSLALWWAFVALYFFGSAWNSTEVGKAIMRQGLFLALLLTLSVLPDGLGFGINTGRWITLIVLALLPVLAVNMILLVRRAQKA